MNSLLEKVQGKLNAHGGFFKAVSVLAGGTAFAQLLSVAILPILTRLYTPEDFSIFAAYSSIVSILAVINCLRFEIAIALPKKDEDAIYLMCLAFISNLCILIFTLVLIFSYYNDLIQFSEDSVWEDAIWLIPLSVFFSGLYNIFQYWSIRKKNFSIIARTRIAQSISGSTSQIGFNFLEKGSMGLIGGQLINIMTGIWSLFTSFRKENRYHVRTITFNNLITTYKKYDKYPKYSSLEALVNSSAVQLPIIIIAFYSVSAEAGYLMLAMKIMGIPMALIGNAVSQVYLSEASEQFLQGNLRKYTLEIILSLLKTITIIFITIGISSSLLFTFIFGEKWEPAGEMVVWMLPWFFMQIISSPVSMSINIIKKQNIALVLQLFGFLIRVGGVVFVIFYFENYVFEYYALSGFIFYSIYLYVILYLLKDNSNHVEGY